MAKAKDVARMLVNLAQKRANKNEGDLITNLRLQKVMYFAQGWYMGKKGKPLFDGEFEAWNYGPVLPEIYHKYKQFGREGICDEEEFDEKKVLTQEEIDHIVEAAAECEKYSTGMLVTKSHETAPWADNYDANKDGRKIPNSEMQEYFEHEEKLETFDEMLDRLIAEGKLDVYEPKLNANGTPIIPREMADEWEYDD